MLLSDNLYSSATLLNDFLQNYVQGIIAIGCSNIFGNGLLLSWRRLAEERNLLLMEPRPYGQNLISSGTSEITALEPPVAGPTEDNLSEH